MDRSNVQTIYALSPVANALLYGTLQPTSGDPGLLHIALHLAGPVDADAVREAWEVVTDRHEVLRSTVHWKETKRPVRVVHKQVPVEFRHLVHPDGGFEGVRVRDWSEGVDLSAMPVDRLTLVSESAEHHHLLWTSHHILSDGWSAAVILEELLAAYAALRAGKRPSLDPVPSVKQYQEWQDAQDTGVSESFWSDYLSDLSPATIPGSVRKADSAFPYPTVPIDLTEADVSSVHSIVESTACTLSSVLQMALSATIETLTGQQDVVFGMTISGRPAEVPGVERMTGLFSKSIPVRLRLDPSRTVVEAATELMRMQASLIRHANVPMDRLVELASLPPGSSLFEAILVLENFPWASIEATTGLGFEVTSFQGTLTTTLPLTFAAIDDNGLRIQLVYDPSRLEVDAAEAVAARFRKALVAVCADPDRRLGDVLDEIPTTPLPQADPDAVAGGAAERSEAREVEPPSDDLELKLARIWSSVLGTSPITPDDDFFDLGGRSIQAVQLFNMVEREMGRKLPISAIFDGRTLRGMADVIRGDGERTSWRALVPIQPFGDRMPLYCIHAREGNVNFYYDLARRMGDDQPVYGIQSVGLNGEPPLRTLAEMGTLYAREIFSVQGRAPCVLAGTCLGVTVAVDVANRLRSMGGDVRLIVAIDGSPFEQRKGETEPAPPLANKVSRHVRNALAGNWGAIGKRIRRHRIRYSNRFRDTRITKLGTDRDRWQLAVIKANVEAARTTYTDEPVDVPVLFVLSSEWAETRSYHVERWKSLAKSGLEVVEIETRHWYLFDEPAVTELGGVVRERVSEVTTSTEEALRPK